MSIHISEKLEISRRLGYLSLIDEGVYLRIYNQSAYIINQLYQQNLKIASHVIGKLQQYQIVYCAFPKKNIRLRFYNARKTSWGYEVKGNFDLSFYDDWFKQFFTVPVSPSRRDCSRQLQFQHTSFNEVQPTRTHQLLTNIYLNPQQLVFLKTWQPGECSPAVVEDFINSLKSQLLK